MTNIPELGIGIIYFSGFKKIIESNFNLIDLIEIEPQTFWLKNKLELDSFIFNENEIGYLNTIDKPKLFHGVGYPIGSSLPLNTDHIPYMKKLISRLNPVWLSEHLSFNNIKLNNQVCNTNFLLPPLQTIEGVKTATERIIQYRSNFDIPFSFETAVNYLQPYDFEMSDGVFVNSIAENSNCYILLDVHNLIANQLNGRQSVMEFVNQVNPERINQIHIASGFTYDGYYLDAHSGISDDDIFDVLEKVVRRLPNLKAITFEMLPEYLKFVSESDIRIQLERMRSIWDKRNTENTIHKTPVTYSKISTTLTPNIEEWENTLGSLALEKQNFFTVSSLGKVLSEDKGVSIIQDLVKKFRRSLLVSSMKLTCRYLMLSNGIDYLNNLFNAFWEVSTPKLFATDNGIDFGNYLIDKLDTEDDTLIDLAIFEIASLKTLLDNTDRVINISFNPTELISYLSKGELPETIHYGNYEITVEASNLFDTEPISSVFHS